MKSHLKKFLTAVLLLALLVMAGTVLARVVLLRGELEPPMSTETIEKPQETQPQETQPQENSVQKTPVPTEPPVEEPCDVVITEIMSRNKSYITDSYGDYSDWIELYNAGEKTASLDGYLLTRDGGSKSWSFPKLTLQPDERRLVFCSGRESTADELHCSFALPKEGGTLALCYPSGNEIQSVSFGESEIDSSFDVTDSGVKTAIFPTPLAPAGEYSAQVQELERHGALVINEVCPYNASYAQQDYKFYDWIELKNTSDAPIELSEYYLGDKLETLTEYRLPKKELAPGGLFIVFCSGDASLSGKGYEHAPFELSAGSESVYLYHENGYRSDSVGVYDVPLAGSFGRTAEGGFAYFTTPTPMSDNGSGKRGYAAMPTTESAQGVFNDVSSVTVELNAERPIYYTLDGAEPTTGSSIYSGPITIGKTSVLRARCFEDGLLPSDILEMSFILNENHTLPVVSVAMEPSRFSTMYESPSFDLEEVGHVSYFNGEKSFDIDCGAKLHGATSKFAQDKRSMKLTFRSRYDGRLNYDLFDDGITEYSSILLRAAQEDYYSTLMHDNVMHQIAVEYYPELPAQDYEYCALYINGAYWGVYNIREAHSATSYAQHYGLDEDNVAQWKGWYSLECLAEGKTWVRDYMVNTDMTYAPNFEKAMGIYDMDNVIAYVILQSWCGNFDCQENNTRLFLDRETGQIRIALVDLDLGWMRRYITFEAPFEINTSIGPGLLNLMNNNSMRVAMLERLSQALQNELSDAAVIERIDATAAEIRDEIERDRVRWGGSLENWEKMVREMKQFATGRAREMVAMAQWFFPMTANEYQNYFANVK